MRIDYFRDGYGPDPASEAIIVIPMISPENAIFYRVEFLDANGGRASIDLNPGELDDLRRKIERT